MTQEDYKRFFYNHYVSNYKILEEIPEEYLTLDMVMKFFEQHYKTHEKILMNIPRNMFTTEILYKYYSFYFNSKRLFKNIPEEFITSEMVKKYFDAQSKYYIGILKYIPEQFLNQEYALLHFENNYREKKDILMHIPKEYITKSMCEDYLKLYGFSMSKEELNENFFKWIPVQYRKDFDDYKKNPKEVVEVIKKEEKDIYDNLIETINGGYKFPFKSLESIPNEYVNKISVDVLYEYFYKIIRKSIPTVIREKYAISYYSALLVDHMERNDNVAFLKTLNHVGSIPNFYVVDKAKETIKNRNKLLYLVTLMGTHDDNLINECTDFDLNNMLTTNPTFYLPILDDYLTDEEFKNRVISILSKVNKKHFQLTESCPNLRKEYYNLAVFNILSNNDQKNIVVSIIMSEKDCIDDLYAEKIMKKYGISESLFKNSMELIKELYPETYDELKQKFKDNSNKYLISIKQDIKNLEKICKLMNIDEIVTRNENRFKFTSDEKMGFAYLYKKYIYHSLDKIFVFCKDTNYFSNKLNGLFKIFRYKLNISENELATYEEKHNILVNESWLKDYSPNQIFQIKDSEYIPTLKYNTVITKDIVDEVNKRLTEAGIPLNSFICKIAYKEYSYGRLDEHIGRFVELDEQFKNLQEEEKLDDDKGNGR